MKKTTPTTLAVLAGALVIAAGVALRPGSAPSDEALAAAGGTQPAEAVAGSAHTLTFDGQGSVTMTPDTATLEVGTDGQAGASADALDQASSRMQAVLAALKGLSSPSIAPRDLQTADVSTWQDSDTGLWHASQSLTVTLHDPSAAGRVLQAAEHAGATEVSGPSFSLTDRRAAYRDALASALADARAKADAVAGAMGVHVSEVLAVSENENTPVLPMMAAGVARSAAASPAPPIEQGSLEVDADVTVTFAYQ